MQFKRIALAVLAAAAFAWSGTSAPAMAKTYKWGSFVPPSSEIYRLSFKGFAEEVKEKTNGAVQFQVFNGGSLVGPRDTLSGIRDGIVDGGFVVAAFVVSSLPNQNIIQDMVSFASDGIQSAGAAAETHLLDCPECQNDYRKMGAISLAGMGSTSYMMQCGKPVNSVEEIKGLKVRVAISGSGRWVKHLGGVPVGGLPPTDIVTAMQRGQVDCAIAIPGWLVGFSLADSVKHLITMPQGNAHGNSELVFSRRLWDGLTRDQKGIMLRAAPHWVAHGSIQTNLIEPKTKIDPVIAKKHITKWDGGAKLRTEWADFLKGERAACVETAVKRGVDKAVATRVIDAHIKNTEKWDKIAKETGTDEKKLADALWNEIYSKVKY